MLQPESVFRRALLYSFAGFLAIVATDHSASATERDPSDERLSFQTSGPWSPRVNLNADVAMVYGIDKTFPDRLASWRDKGYTVQLMTGVSWGEYQDYLYGRFDGKNHEAEAQQNRAGEKRSHGGDVYYMSPGESYGLFLAAGVRRALDAGATAVYLEEPEFWVSSGWESNFKTQWNAYYHEDWVAPDSSPDAQYRASKLKYYLYRRALAQIFDSVKQWGQEHHKTIPCYVPTHSLLNYAHWDIVSPESSLLDVGCDGYIAQVWTGTARTPNVYEGREKERTFETAFLEYGAMQNLVRASGRRVWDLNDPIEDNAGHTWKDYRTNWESTLTASLLQPEVYRYEIMPWPQRIFTRRYPSDDPARRGRRDPIPPAYETELQAVITALGDMKQEKVKWETAGTLGVGVLVSDTMMFQRGGRSPSDTHLGSFYGLAMPLLKRGMPVEPVQIESATTKGFLDRYRMLLLTYEGQKPPTPVFHAALAEWVNAGGALLIVDNDEDPYNTVREWWDIAPMRYKTPRHHLMETLGLPIDAAGTQKVGKGVVVIDAASPATLTYQPTGADHIRAAARRAAEAVGLKWEESPALVLRRGPYVIATGMDETEPDAAPVMLRGNFVPLFDAGLPVVKEYAVKPNSRGVLIDLAALPDESAGVIAAACRVKDQKISAEGITFHADGIDKTNGAVLVAMKRAPKSVEIAGKLIPAGEVDYAEGILRLRFGNSVEGVMITIGR